MRVIDLGKAVNIDHDRLGEALHEWVADTRSGPTIIGSTADAVRISDFCFKLVVEGAWNMPQIDFGLFQHGSKSNCRFVQLFPIAEDPITLSLVAALLGAFLIGASR